MKLNRVNFEIAKISEDNEYRKGMLFISGHETVSTDGKRLMVVELPEKNGQLQKGYIISKDNALRRARSLDTKLRETSTLTFSNSHLEIDNLIVPTVQRDYYDYKAAFPKGEPAVEFTYNPKYLYEMFSIFGKYCKDYAGVDLRIFEDGLLWAQGETIAKQQIDGLLMPIRRS